MSNCMVPRRLVRVVIGMLLGCLGPYSSSQPHDAERQKRRPVTVTDAIEMAQIGDRSYLSNFVATGNVVQFSPDRSKFAFVTQKGNLTNDTVEFRLLIFKTANIFSAAKADVVATMASSSNREAIRSVQWLPDNDTIVFLGEQPGETPQLYKVSVTTKKLDKLTHHPVPIVEYSMSDRGDSFVFVSETAPHPVYPSDMERHGFFISSQYWQDLYTNRPAVDTRYEVYVQTSRMKAPQQAGNAMDLVPSNMGLTISPNGHYALLQAYRTSPPAAWNEYQYKSDIEAGEHTVSCPQETRQCPLQFYVVDLNEKTIEPLLNVPIVTTQPAGTVLATWTHRSTVFTVNSLLPLDSVRGAERTRRLNHVYTAEITLPDRTIETITEHLKPYPAFFIQLDPVKDRIVLRTGVEALGPSLEIDRNESGWTVTEMKEVTGAQQLSVTLDQDINSPPKLVAHDPQTNHSAVVLDLNPQFSQLSFGPVKIFKWKTPEGWFGEGMLYYPPDYIVGNKYPLIIQTHDERRNRFWIDGPYTTAYAAQPLANRGFIVLQTGLVDIYEKASVDELYDFLGTPKEGTHYMSLLQSAIDALDDQGLVDRTRVGLSGFSRTAYHVLYMLTHSKYSIAAAVAADGVNFGYVDCVYYLAASNSSLCEQMNGGAPPYSDGLAGWEREAPTFRLDKIGAPLLLQAITSPLGEWEIFAGLRWLKKPVDMLNFYPEGEHVLIRPTQRLLSQGSVVDWYCFWLKGEEDPDPTKVGQYVRWQKMKVQRDKQKEQAAPLDGYRGTGL